MNSRWRLAARLARREVRRHPGRTALAVLILGIPVLGAQAAAVAWRTNVAKDHRVDVLRREGAGLAVPVWALAQFADGGNGDVLDGTRLRDGLRRALPAGTRYTIATTQQSWVATTRLRADGRGPVLASVEVGQAVSSSPRDDIVRGRAPRGAGEALVSRAVLDATGRRVGQRLALPELGRTVTISGEVRRRDDLTGRQVLTGDLAQGIAPGLPAGVSGSDLMARASSSEATLLVFADRLPTDVLDQLRPFQDADRDDPSVLARLGDRRVASAQNTAIAAGVAGVIGMIAVVASAAFAIGARRQLRGLGTLAASGAAPADLRRAVVLQGTVTGTVAWVVATAATVVGTLVAHASGLVERLSDVQGVPVVLPWGLLALAGTTALVAGTLAAVLPARAAARIPVLTALAGRRPVPPVKARVPLLDVVGVLGGAATIASLSRGRSWDTPIAVVAVLAIVFGGVALAPLLVALVGRVAGRAGGSVRFALRGLSRHRARSAAAAGAVAAVLAGPVAMFTYTATQAADEQPLQDATASVTVYGTDAPGADDVVAQAADVLGPTAWVLRSAMAPAAEDADSATAVLVAERLPDEVPAALAPIRAALAAGRPVALLAPGSSAAERLAVPVAAHDRFRPGEGGLGRDDARRMLAEHVGARGVIVPKGYLGATTEQDRAVTLLRPDPLDQRTEDALHALVGDDAGPTLAEVRQAGRGTAAASPGESPRVGIITNFVGTDRHASGLARGLELAALTVALLVVAIALGLHAIDGREERALLAAVGAPPRSGHRSRAIEAFVITAIAVVLAAAIGWLAMAAALHARHEATNRSLARYQLTYGPGIGEATHSRSVAVFPTREVAVLGGLLVGLATAGAWVADAGGTTAGWRRRRPDLVLATE